MDRFVLQYHIRQFGTKKLARRNLHQLCKSITKLASSNPRIMASGEPVDKQHADSHERKE